LFVLGGRQLRFSNEVTAWLLRQRPPWHVEQLKKSSLLENICSSENGANEISVLLIIAVKTCKEGIRHLVATSEYFQEELPQNAKFVDSDFHESIKTSSLGNEDQKYDLRSTVRNLHDLTISEISTVVTDLIEFVPPSTITIKHLMEIIGQSCRMSEEDNNEFLETVRTALRFLIYEIQTSKYRENAFSVNPDPIKCWQKWVSKRNSLC